MNTMAQDYSGSINADNPDLRGQNATDPSFLGSMCQFSDPFTVLYFLSASSVPCTFALSPEHNFPRTTSPMISNQLTYSPDLVAPTPMNPFDYQQTSIESLPAVDMDSFIPLPSLTPDKGSSGDNISPPLNSVNPWVYSSSGFDLIGILSKVINRPFPSIHIGPVDLSCAFIVVDARKFDFPIVYASESFEKLTGYNNPEIIGRNCRFLQSPDGHVTLGSRRRYTDNTVVHQIKNSMVRSKESQVSIVNYKKNGQPFINLITIIPVTLGDAITYYVGFQVDMVDQPNAILEKMKNGTYAVNYSSLSIPSYLSGVDEGFQGLSTNVPYQNSADLFESIMGRPKNEDSQRDWSQFLIENSEEFIYVLTLKGIILYASPSSLRLFGYNNEDLMGHSVSKICHPNDIVPIMREMKESINSTDASLGLTFRTRCSTGEYTWMESVGKLHADSAKGRRFIVFSGRVRPQASLSLQSVLASGPLGPDEFWSRISSDGLYLFVTASCFQAVGYSADELIGTSMYQLIRSDRTAALTQALQQAEEGFPLQLCHQIQSKRGQPITVTSYFYPSNSSGTFLCRTRLGDFCGSDGIPYHTAATPSEETTNFFESIEPNNNTTWQYELHQLQLANDRLKQEIAGLSAYSPAGTKKSKRRHIRPVSLICLTCHRTESPEWRRGPQGPKTLCNSCGIKYAKKVSSKRPFASTDSLASSGSSNSSAPGSDGESGASVYRPIKSIKRVA